MLNKYTIAERQAIKDRLADESHFDRDRELFAQLFPHNPMLSELARANRVNKPGLCRRMIYQMLQKVDEAAILEWRESGARVAEIYCYTFAHFYAWSWKYVGNFTTCFCLWKH